MTACVVLFPYSVLSTDMLATGRARERNRDVTDQLGFPLVVGCLW